MGLPAMTIDGDVIAAHSYWTDDGSRIVTEATVRTDDGQTVVVSQLGGSVDGIGMITMPGPPVLAPGMRVAVAAHRDLDLASREHVVLDGVKVLAYPPGYVRSGPTHAGHSLYWESGCVFVTIDDAGTAAIAGDGEFAVIDAAIATWNTGTVSPTCSYLRVMSDGRKPVEVGNDHVNVIKFRDTVWGRPAAGNDPPRMYSPGAAGITALVFVDNPASARDGAIVDADVEINGVDFAISVAGQTTSTQACKSELANTLTHELGHLHGLEHPCLATGDPPRVDDMGNDVPACSTVELDPTLPSNRAILDATMYNFEDCGETKKETLSPDDLRAICEIYPAARDPGTCARVPPPGSGGPPASGDGFDRDGAVGSTGGGCCSAAGRDRPEPIWLLAAATIALATRRRRTLRA
ncbi:MAG TPA: hypothetical protein VFT22_12620 [Kofleriaceae bacterium]|nr:hypothetical protein [Kofleriaceae bacterium]